MTLLVSIILGIPLLLWGRRAFWLFVGAVGFIIGFWLAQRFLTTNIEWVLFAMAAALGLVGVLFAIMAQKMAVIITGFFTGIYLSISIMDAFSISIGPWNVFIYIFGGMIGTLLVLGIFDWALIILSSLVGASLISQSSFHLVQISIAPRSIIFLVLLVIGIIVQYEQKTRET